MHFSATRPLGLAPTSSSEYEAFALLNGLRLMAHGRPRLCSFDHARLRAELENEHARILKQNPDELFDEQAIREKAQPGDIAVDNTDPVFLTIASRESPEPDKTAAVCRGLAEVYTFGRSFGASSLTFLEVATLSHKLHDRLNRTNQGVAAEGRRLNSLAQRRCMRLKTMIGFQMRDLFNLATWCYMSIHKVRGRPFKPGNPGRPAGSKNKTTQILQQLVEGQAEHLVQKAVKMAQAGDVACLRMVLDRLWPVRKGQPVQVLMPPINTSQDLLPAIASIWSAVAEGRLTPDEASALSIVIDRTIKAIELHDISKRITALEQAQAKQDESNNPPSS